jgi:hypothetical protein
MKKIVKTLAAAAAATAINTAASDTATIDNNVLYGGKYNKQSNIDIKIGGDTNTNGGELKKRVDTMNKLADCKEVYADDPEAKKLTFKKRIKYIDDKCAFITKDME